MTAESVSMEAVMKAIYQWVTARFTSIDVAWADYRRQDRPSKPYLILSLLSPPSRISEDEEIIDGSTKIIKGDRSLTINFLFYPDEKITYTSIDSLRFLQDSFHISDEKKALTDAGIVVESTGSLLNITDSTDIKYAFDLTLRIVYRRTLNIGTIDIVTPDIEVNS